MDSSIDLSELTQILQCAVCLETVRNPKMLRCNHSYCKRCLDNLLTFGREGTAVITCPKGCARVTKLSNIQTTEDLGVDYMLKGILEKVAAKDKQLEEDDDDDEDERVTCAACTRDATRYCFQCKLLKCSSCRDRHDLVNILTGDYFIPVRFNDEEKKLMVMCRQHATEATYMCCGTKFVCIYCINRTHIGHQYNTLDSAERMLKETLKGEIEFSENLTAALNETKKDIASARSRLEEVLKINKLKCIENYSTFLNTQEEQIKNDFDEVTDEHISPFTALDSSNFLKQCLNKEGANLLLNKNEITSKINNRSKVTREITVSLTASQHMNQNPLGSLNVMHGKRASIDKHTKTFKSIITPNLAAHPSVASLRNLKDMLEKACDELNEKADEKRKAKAGPSSTPNTSLTRPAISSSSFSLSSATTSCSIPDFSLSSSSDTPAAGLFNSEDFQRRLRASMRNFRRAATESSSVDDGARKKRQKRQ